MKLLCLVRTVVPLLVISTLYAAQSKDRSLILQVTDAAGGIVPTASARLLSSDRVIESKADSNGNVRFGSVIPGSYQLEVFAPGFIKKTINSIRVSQAESAPVEVVLQVSNQPDHCGFVNTVEYGQLQPGAVLQGRVVDADRNVGIAKASVTLQAADKGISIDSVRSDKNGTFAFADLQPGRYSLRVSKDGYMPSSLQNFFVPRENTTALTLGLDKRGHIHVCQ